MTREEAINHIVNDCFIFLGGQLCVDADKKGRFCEAIGKGVSALCAQKEAEKNEPLTLDELREMAGEPVWCVSQETCEWMLAGKDDCEGRRYIFDFSNYGKTWLAYRRKPEKVQK